MGIMPQYRRRHQRGEVMTVVVIILVVALIGALGFIAWQNFGKKEFKPAGIMDDTVRPADHRATKDDETSKDATSNWLLYASSKGKFSVRLPDGWRVNNENDSWLVSRGYSGETPNIGNHGVATSITLKTGTKAVVSDIGGPGECYGCRFVLQQRDDFLSYGAEKRESIKTSQGNVIDRYQSTLGEDDFGGVSGTKLYQYHIHAKEGTKDIIVSYSVQPGEADIVETVDRLVTTIHFSS